MFDNIFKLFKKLGKKEPEELTSKEMAKERLHLVLMQDRANVSADFLDMMRQEIIDVIKKYIDVDEQEIDVRLTNKMNEDGTTGAPALYANIPIAGIKQNLQPYTDDVLVLEKKADSDSEQKERDSSENDKKEEIKENDENKDKKENIEDKKDNIDNENLKKGRDGKSNSKSEKKTEKPSSKKTNKETTPKTKEKTAKSSQNK